MQGSCGEVRKNSLAKDTPMFCGYEILKSVFSGDLIQKIAYTSFMRHWIPSRGHTEIDGQ